MPLKDYEDEVREPPRATATPVRSRKRSFTMKLLVLFVIIVGLGWATLNYFLQ